jgi:hypothetical protein
MKHDFKAPWALSLQAFSTTQVATLETLKENRPDVASKLASSENQVQGNPRHLNY